MKRKRTIETRLALWLCLVCCVPFAGMADEVASDDGGRSIKGRVFDENREPMAGVLVLVKGTTRGVTTGIEGEYELQLQPQDSILEFSFLGYKTRQLKITRPRSIVNVNMTEPAILSFSNRKTEVFCAILYSPLVISRAV